METLTCPRCTATVQTDSIEEGRKKLDHAIGLSLGKPCEDGKVELIWTGSSKPKTEKPKKPNVGKTKSDSFSKE